MGSSQVMEPINFNYELIITYVLYWYFLFYITKWMKDFKGASQTFYNVLTFCSSVGTLFGLGVLIAVAYHTGLINGLILMGISVVTNIILVVIESTITMRLLKIDYAVEKIGMVSFFLVPFLAYRLVVLLGIV